MKPLAIIGLDPGTTSGYVILNLKGELVSSDSAKELTLSEIIARVINLCHPVIVATDKAKTPFFIEEFSAKLGAVIVKPNEDLTKEQKHELLKGVKKSGLDAHQQDSLAAAVFAFKQSQPKLNKINHYLTEHHLEQLRNEFTKIAIKEELNFTTIKDLLTKSSEETAIVRKAVQEEKLTKANFLRLYQKLADSKAEKYQLQNRLTELKKELNNVSKVNRFLEQKKNNFNVRVDTLFKVKEKRLRTQEQNQRLLIERIQKLERQNDQLHSFIEQSSRLQLLKKLDNLGQAEFDQKNQVLKIKPSDVLLIKEPQIYSEHVLNLLQQKEVLLISDQKMPKLLQQRFSTANLNAAVLANENEYFALLPRQELDKALAKKVVIEKIIENYKEERKG